MMMINAVCFWRLAGFAYYFCPDFTEVKWGRHHEAIYDALDASLGKRGHQINIVAPRSSAKSTIVTNFLPLHSLYFKSCYEIMNFRPYHFIIILSQSESLAKMMVRDIKNKIEYDENFRWLLGSEWGITRMITSNNSQIIPKGRRAQTRGSRFGPHRPDLCLSDDYDHAEEALNPEVRAKNQLWFDTDYLRCGDPLPDKKTNFINVDTIKHEEATASLLRYRAGWQNLFFQAIEDPPDLWHPTAENLWRQWEKLYTDMSLETAERNALANAFYERNRDKMTAGVKELWPEKITYLDIRKEICDMGYFPVLRELQNSTRDPSQALFDMQSALYFDIKQEGFLRDDDVLVQWRQMAGATIFLDWAGGKDIADNAFAAVVGVVWVPLPGSGTSRNASSIMDGVHGYVISADLRRMGATEQISACFEMYQYIRATVQNRDFKIRLGIEGFVQDVWHAQQQVIERDFRTQRETHDIDIKLEWLTRLRNKFDRIDALQPLIRNRWLGFKNGLQNEFMKQMMQYPTADFLDGPDALEGACQLRVSRFNKEIQARRDRLRERNKNFKVTL